MKCEHNLYHILSILFIISYFNGSNVLCNEERDLQENEEAELVKLFGKCGSWDERSPAPWTVTIFYFYADEYPRLCEGSIVTPNVVITAAQCFTSYAGLNNVYNLEDIYVAAGKYTTDLLGGQFSETYHVKVKEIHITPEYKQTLTDYADNLAVVVLQKPFQITNLVQPVCFDRNNEIESQNPFHNNHKTERWNVDQYEYFDVNATDKISLNKCFEKFPKNSDESIKAFNYLCSEVTGGPAFCRNFGGALVLNNNQQFYIRGVLGFAPTIKREDCDPNLHYGIFTNISDYNAFILKITDEHEIKFGDCPSLTIDHGIIEVLGQKQSYKPGTPVRNYDLVKFTCDTNYALRPTSPLVTCVDGNFTNPIPQCKRILKGAVDEVINLIEECGYWDENPPAPWNVAVYHKYENDTHNFICGGSIITANVIITAGVCITQFGTPPAEEFYVAAGKYYYDYDNADEDEFAQKTQVKEYHIPREYIDGTFDEGDLAVVILKDPFHTTNLVQPVCLDRNNKIESRQVTPNNTGIVTAWSIGNELKQSNAFYINKEECLDRNKATWFKRQFTSDKFCAHYINCGRYGGGVAYKWYTNNKQQFYIRGVKTYIESTNCNGDQLDIGLFTNITFHKEFILQIIDQQLRADSCPSISIENGQSTVLGQGHIPKNGSIPNHNILKLTCNANYTLHPAYPTVACIDGNWNLPIPECKLTCLPTISSSADVTCTLAGNPVDCNQPLVEGAVARSKCKLFYKPSDYDIQISTCTRGAWSNPVVRCAPECGEVVSKGVTNVVNGESAQKGNFPWHIALYRLVGQEHKYHCGGSIINPLIIITAAHCFTDQRATKYPANEFYIGAGKYYSDYNSAKDIYAQKRQVKEYHIPTEYRGYETNYAGDLAVVVVKRAFRMTNLVQPVCVDWIGSLESEQLKHNNTGSVVGWGYVDPNIPKESSELKQLNPPYINRDQCLNEVPLNFRRWITLDKFCAGFTNGTSVCRGDSGGGLVFKENNVQRYFIRGVVSVGPVREGETRDVCDQFQYGVYTQISYYIRNNYILNIITANPLKN